MVKWIIVAVLLLPVAEIATFVVVGLVIGFGWALVLSLVTSIAGFLVLQQAGRGRLAGFRNTVAKDGLAKVDAKVDIKVGIEAGAGSFLIVLAGILLFLPRFLTDLAGALLLIGPIRRAFAAAFQRMVVVRARSAQGGRQVIDLEPDQWKQVPDREQPKPRNTLDKS